MKESLIFSSGFFTTSVKPLFLAILINPNSSDFEANMSQNWRGNNLEVEVLYSKAGIATQILVTDLLKGDLLLMDCGDGTVRDLVDRGIDLQQLKGILISHGHTDHISGLDSLLFVLYLARYEGELMIIAPSPCNEVHSLIKRFLSHYRGRLKFTLHYHELYGGVTESIAQFIIKPFDVLHYGSVTSDPKILPAFGYRVNIQDEVIVYTGDTAECPQLEKEIEGADLALIEATYDQPFQGNLCNHLHANYAEYLGKSAKNYFLIHSYPFVRSD